MFMTLEAPCAAGVFDQVNKRIGEQEQQGDGDADDGHRVEQAGDDEHLGLQSRSELRLPRRSFQELAAQQREADGGAQRTEANEQADGQNGIAQQLSD